MRWSVGHAKCLHLKTRRGSDLDSG
jgi:hypothetical protein